ncbi:YggS family pyridoxal phosphate-dependent enzyme [Candidatus Sumerlaeota bacterium]|nr:YggS family pyridoxal phosphate-dependent enzyme [Candidatus Sumerlaeota bacterium]
MSVPENLHRIQQRIRLACERAGRDPHDVRLVAVTKNHGAERVSQALDAGCGAFGENRVQEAQEKIPRLPPAEWHLIGHLQRNKARLAVQLFHMIHSVDSERLARALSQAAESEGRSIEILLQVNVSGEESKFGAEPEQVEALARTALGLPGLRVRGLMTMAPYSDDPEDARPVFRGLRELRDQLRQKGLEQLRELSMGMSGDFETAIEEGATLVRVGSAIFDEAE